MGDARGHDPEPDRAALDELRRAFGRGDATLNAPDVVSVEHSDEPPIQSPADPPSGLVIIEQAAFGHDEVRVDLELVEPPSEIDSPEPTPEVIARPVQRIIRIDDITGAVADVDQTPVDAQPDAVEPLLRADEPVRPATVIAIDADDLPDAVYVAGSLEGGSSRSIVFIEDDIAADAMSPESDRDLRRGIEPRMRERRLQVRRAQSRKRLKWVVLGVVLALIGIGALAVLGSSLFAVRADSITVTGNVYTDPDALQAVLDDLDGTPTLLVDTQGAEQALEAIPWVDDAKVSVDFPHSVAIEIRERQAMATYQGPDQRFRVIDRDGRVLDVIDKWPIAYVLIDGPDPADLDAGQFAPQGYVAAAELAKNLTGSVRGQVDHIEVTADGQTLVMWLDDGTDVRFGEARDLFTKLVRLETRLADPEREPGTIDVSTG